MKSETWAGLVRVSMDDQECKRQYKAIRIKSEEDGNPIPQDYWFEDKESRDQDFKRADFQRLLSLIEKGKVKGVYIEKFDRFGVQDKYEAFHYLYLFRRANCRLVSCQPNEGEFKDDTADGIKVFFLAEQSEKEQKDKGQRVTSGKLEKAQTAESPWQGGIPPYGFDKVVMDKAGRLLYGVHYLKRDKCVQIFPCAKCTEANQVTPSCPDCQRLGREGNDMPLKSRNEKATLILSEDRSRVAMMKQLFKWLTENAIRSSKLAKWANQAGMTIYGKPIRTHSTLTFMLRNPAYMGSFGWNRHSHGRFYEVANGRATELPLPPGGKRRDRNVYRPKEEWVLRPDAWPPIVDKETWETAFAKLGKKKGPRPASKPDLWMHGIIHCATCEQPMTPKRIVSKGEKVLHYHCVTWDNCKRVGLPSKCGYNCVKASEVEKVIKDYVGDLGIDLANAGKDPSALLRLYEKRDQKKDLLYRMIKKDIRFYGETIRSIFNLDSKSKKTTRLAHLVDKLCPSEEALSPVLAFLENCERLETGAANVTYEAPVDAMLAADGPVEDWPHAEALPRVDELAELIQEIEETKAILARQEIDQAQGELLDLTKAKAFAKSDRERKALDTHLFRLNERLDELEDHLTPLTKRRGERAREWKQLQEQCKDAEAVLADGQSFEKAEAVKRVLGEGGKVLLHFEQVQPKKGKRLFSRFRPDFTHFACVKSDSEIVFGVGIHTIFSMILKRAKIAV